MDNLLETNFYLFISVIYIIVLSIVGVFFGLMAFLENRSEGETITFKESIVIVLKGLSIIILVGFVLGTITYFGSNLLCDMGLDASNAPENPYF